MISQLTFGDVSVLSRSCFGDALLRHDQDIMGENFPGACTAPDHLIHVRPQAYRYWGISSGVNGTNRKQMC